MVFLIPSYYAGWIKGEYYFEEKMAFVNCYSLTHGTECLFPPPFHGMPAAYLPRLIQRALMVVCAGCVRDTHKN